MSWLLFLDESGHDHKNMPYEVRGGVALHAGRLWPFIQGMQRLELDSFGCQLHQFRKELKGSFMKTAPGRERTVWIVPSPFFVASDMVYPIQAADMCIYCVNLGFRIPSQGMDQPVRQEIADDFGPWINRLQFRGEGYRDGHVFETYGICYVPNPYGPGRA